MIQASSARARLVGVSLTAVFTLGVAAAAFAEAKETERVEKTVPFATGGTLKVSNFSGRVEITGEQRPDVSIVAIRRATRSRLDHIKLAIETSGSTVTIEANRRDDSWKEEKDNVVETEMTIRVPASAELDINVFSSPVTVTGVTGRHHVHGFSADLHLDRTAGPIDAETFSGAIYLSPASWDKDQSVKAKTFSGDIELKLPASAGGSVEFDSFSGDIRADVPLLLQSKSRRALRAQLKDGAGSGALYFKTFSGDVRLLK
jgi:DUF4097 and DUF4098 domain-containing protein YvlB